MENYDDTDEDDQATEVTHAVTVKARLLCFPVHIIPPSSNLQTYVSGLACQLPSVLSHHNLDGSTIACSMVEREDGDFLLWL